MNPEFDDIIKMSILAGISVTIAGLMFEAVFYGILMILKLNILIPIMLNTMTPISIVAGIIMFFWISSTRSL